MTESEGKGTLLMFSFRCPVCGLDLQESAIVLEPRYACPKCEAYYSTPELHEFYGGAADVGL